MRVISSLLVCLALVACNEDVPHDPPADTGSADTGADTALADTGTALDATPDATDASETEPPCFDKPKTHYEIINACTDAALVDKKPTGLPFLPDGGLPTP